MTVRPSAPRRRPGSSDDSPTTAAESSQPVQYRRRGLFHDASQGLKVATGGHCRPALLGAARSSRRRSADGPRGRPAGRPVSAAAADRAASPAAGTAPAERTIPGIPGWTSPLKGQAPGRPLTAPGGCAGHRREMAPQSSRARSRTTCTMQLQDGSPETI